MRPAGASPRGAARCQQRPEGHRDPEGLAVPRAGGRLGSTRSARAVCWGSVEERREWVEGKSNATSTPPTGGAAGGSGAVHQRRGPPQPCDTPPPTPSSPDQTWAGRPRGPGGARGHRQDGEVARLSLRRAGPAGGSEGPGGSGRRAVLTPGRRAGPRVVGCAGAGREWRARVAGAPRVGRRPGAGTMNQPRDAR